MYSYLLYEISCTRMDEINNEWKWVEVRDWSLGNNKIFFLCSPYIQSCKLEGSYSYIFIDFIFIHYWAAGSEWKLMVMNEDELKCMKWELGVWSPVGTITGKSYLASIWFQFLSTMSLRRGVGADLWRLHTYKTDIFLWRFVSSTLIIGTSFQ